MKRVRSNVGGEGVPRSAAEKKLVVLLGDAVISKATVSEARTGSLSPVRGRLQVLGPVATSSSSRTGSISSTRGFLRCSGDVVGLGLVAAASVGNFAVHDPSQAKVLLWCGFLLRQSSDLAGLSYGVEQLLWFWSSSWYWFRIRY